jgi:hypothetical protein
VAFKGQVSDNKRLNPHNTENMHFTQALTRDKRLVFPVIEVKVEITSDIRAATKTSADTLLLKRNMWNGGYLDLQQDRTLFIM